jgi:hypothetical protein
MLSNCLWVIWASFGKEKAQQRSGKRRTGNGVVCQTPIWAPTCHWDLAKHCRAFCCAHTMGVIALCSDLWVMCGRTMASSPGKMCELVSPLSGPSMVRWESRVLREFGAARSCRSCPSQIQEVCSRNTRQLPLSPLPACGRYVYGEKNPIGKDEPLLLEESHRI